MALAVIRSRVILFAMKKNDDQICVKLSRPLRVELEDEAAAQSRSLSNLIRTLLINHTAQRITERNTADEPAKDIAA